MNSGKSKFWLATYNNITLAFPVVRELPHRYVELAESIIEIEQEGVGQTLCSYRKTRKSAPLIQVATAKMKKKEKEYLGFVYRPVPGENIFFSIEDIAYWPRNPHRDTPNVEFEKLISSYFPR